MYKYTNIVKFWFQLSTSRLKFHRKPAPPSIPTPGQSYGYEENDDGTLRKQDPPEKDASLGPAYYGVKHVRLTLHWIHFSQIYFIWIFIWILISKLISNAAALQ